MSILYHLENYTKIIEKPLGILTSGTTDCGNGVYLLKAGTPISNAGAVANTGDAKYLVEEDFYFYSNTPNQPKNVRLIAAGYVDLDKAQAAAGITYSDACKSALATAGILFVEGALPGGGGSGVLVVNATVDFEHAESETEYPLILNKTLEEILAAEASILDINLGEPGAYYVLSEDFRDESYGVGWFSVVDGTPIYAMVDGDGAQYSIGDAFATTEVVLASVEPFVLHGTITDQQTMSGTITETPTQLDTAIAANKRIVFSIQLDQYNTTIADTTIHIDSGNLGQVNGFALVTVNNTPLLASFRVYPNDGDTLVFASSLFTLTPAT